AAVLGRLTHSRWHAGLLQAEHRLIRLLRLGPTPDHGIEGLLVRQTSGERGEPGIYRPFGVASDLSQGAPFGLCEAGDSYPAILPTAGIDAVGRGWLVRRAVAVARPDAPVGRPVEDGGAADEQADFGLRGINPLSFTRTGAMEQAAEHSQREAVCSHPIEVGVAPASWHGRLGETRHL